MKFEKISRFMQSDEKITARLKPNLTYVIRYILVAIPIGIVVVMPFLMCIIAVMCYPFYFILTAMGGNSPSFNGFLSNVDWLNVILYLLPFGLCGEILVFIMQFIFCKNVEYVVTDKFVFVPVRFRLLICPLNELTILNEKRIRNKKSKNANIYIKCLNAKGTSKRITKRVLYGGRICLQAIDNPESVINLLKSPIITDK